MKIRPAYVDRCKNYLLWLGEPLFMVDTSLPDVTAGEYTAVEAMSLKESQGKAVTCSEPRLYDALCKGKQAREFHIKGWLSMTRMREALPEEFFGCLGLRSSAEFQGIFGRLPSLPTLRIIHRQLGPQIELYENMLSGSSDSVSGSEKK